MWLSPNNLTVLLHWRNSPKAVCQQIILLTSRNSKAKKKVRMATTPRLREVLKPFINIDGKEKAMYIKILDYSSQRLANYYLMIWSSLLSEVTSFDNYPLDSRTLLFHNVELWVILAEIEKILNIV
ncbi:hypothetical protein CDAR_276411 [Caerostris darwini]|uniref:Uncharacterized protein n=1 Tax=Caerostris darwini TaxID=1538125 RepID=A0AAV4QDL7_9ARAC|nr:hypothetical protein CDAR_276411 [Caerostris darwini]